MDECSKGAFTNARFIYFLLLNSFYKHYGTQYKYLNIQNSLRNLKIQVPISIIPRRLFFKKYTRVSESSIPSLFYRSEQSCATTLHPASHPSPAGGQVFSSGGDSIGALFTQGQSLHFKAAHGSGPLRWVTQSKTQSQVHSLHSWPLATVSPQI